ncbi:hypothetical protein MHH37_06700 [Solibacillus sp. FSL K6-1781]|uniref:hypothetical protein n=1 Tax=Solibacillus sp. FSL K6-1781 TaxID=2921474 RepID=UPI003159B6BE
MPEVTSMQEAFKKVGEHDVAINQNILPRIEVLEKEHLDFKQEMTSFKAEMTNLQKGQKDVEVTVMKDGKETRDLLKPFAEHALKQMEFDAKAKQEIAIKKLDNKDKATVALYGALGSGGLVTVIAGFLALFK